MSSSTSISIVIRTFNSAKTLGLVLEGLKLIPGDELIVVDSGSTDSTLQIAAAYNAKIIHAPPPFHYSKSLNLGFATAINLWVLVISSHSIPLDQDFMGTHRKAIEGFPSDIIVGYAPSTLTGFHSPGIEEISIYDKDAFERLSWQIVGNGNTIYRLEAWNELKFDESIRTSEDKLWLKQMVERNYRFAYNPFPRAIAKYRGSLRYMFTKGFVDARAAQNNKYKPMGITDLSGALKNTFLMFISGRIDPATTIRIMSSTLGQFFGSYQKYKNCI